MNARADAPPPPHSSRCKSRSRSRERRFDALDGARALAFLAVLAVHVDEVMPLRTTIMKAS